MENNIKDNPSENWENECNKYKIRLHDAESQLTHLVRLNNYAEKLIILLQERIAELKFCLR